MAKKTKKETKTTANDPKTRMSLHSKLLPDTIFLMSQLGSVRSAESQMKSDYFDRLEKVLTLILTSGQKEKL